MSASFWANANSISRRCSSGTAARAPSRSIESLPPLLLIQQLTQVEVAVRIGAKPNYLREVSIDAACRLFHVYRIMRAWTAVSLERTRRQRSRLRIALAKRRRLARYTIPRPTDRKRRRKKKREPPVFGAHSLAHIGRRESSIGVSTEARRRQGSLAIGLPRLSSVRTSHLPHVFSPAQLRRREVRSLRSSSDANADLPAWH
jgi:hypothetical protein